MSDIKMRRALQVAKYSTSCVSLEAIALCLLLRFSKKPINSIEVRIAIEDESLDSIGEHIMMFNKVTNAKNPFHSGLGRIGNTLFC
jgi:hypothetical protein